MLDEKNYRHLVTAVENSYRKLDSFRKLALNLVKEYAGPGYGDESDRGHEKHMNLMNQAVDAYMMLLSANTPRTLVSTHEAAFTPFATHYQIALNNLLKEIDFGTTHYDWVLDAFFCVGIIKVHMADSGQMRQEGDILMDPGMPYASNVSIDDFVCDMSARKTTEATFFGDMYRIPFDSLKDEIYDKEVVSDLRPTSKVSDSERQEQVGAGHSVDNDEFEPQIDLADIYVPREKKIYTFAVKNRGTFQMDSRPLTSFDWIGTEKGPYKFLGFNPVPKNIMPVSPAAHLSSLDRLVNNLMRKQARQAHRQKENPVYTPAGANDANSLRQASDGEWVKVQDPKEVNVIRQGGPDPGNQNFLINSIEMFDRMAGNLPAMMGLGTSADTVGQERLIHAAGSRKGGQMQRRVLEATTEVVEELAYLLWVDQFKEIPGEIELEGMPEYRVRSDWKPDDREGEWKDYGFQIDVHSLSYQAPSERVQAINGLLGSIYIPMMQALQQQGGQIDFQRLTKLYSELLNLPRLGEIVVFTAPIDDTSGGPPTAMGPGKPATTERRYVRTDGKGGSPAVPSAANWSQSGNGSADLSSASKK
jgi:hypothetical protein